jgi:hypothetical protein
VAGGAKLNLFGQRPALRQRIARMELAGADESGRQHKGQRPPPIYNNIDHVSPYFFSP